MNRKLTADVVKDPKKRLSAVVQWDPERDRTNRSSYKNWLREQLAAAPLHQMSAADLARETSIYFLRPRRGNEREHGWQMLWAALRDWRIGLSLSYDADEDEL